MRAGRTLAALAALGAAGGTARAAAAAEMVRPAVAADPAATAPDAGGLPPLRLRPPGSGARLRDRAPAPAFSLTASARTLPPAPRPRPGSRRARLLLPVWQQMAFGSWPVAEGRSHLVYPGLAGRESWRSGFAPLGTLSPRLSLGAEFSHDPPDLLDGHANNALAIGARYRLAGPLSLVVSGGPYVEHRGGTGLVGSAGLRIAF